LQIENGDKYRKAALGGKNKFVNSKELKRGKIFFKMNGEDVPGAVQKYGYTLIANNKDNKFLKNNDKEKVFQ
jgi:hypothetical protein